MDLLIKKLSLLLTLVHFTLNYNTKTLKNSFWSNPKTIFFGKTSLKIIVQFLIENSYFTVGNVLLLQTVGIPMRTDSPPFWANLHSYNYESKYITNLIKRSKFRGRRFHSTFGFIVGPCALNNGDKFGKAFLEIHPTELELKVEDNGSHSTFPDLDIAIEKGKSIYKMIFGQRF